jgi:micrococcal nuclease
MGTRAARLVVLLAFAVGACGGANAPAPLTTFAAPTQQIAIPSKPTGPTEVATVLKITDGDTIRVDRGHGSEPVRYIGIDAPEPGEPGGAEATARNAALVKKGAEVVLERDVSDVDRFDRLLRYVWLHEGDTWTLVNLQLIRDGVARAAAYPPDVMYRGVFADAQAVAEGAKLGVWGLLGGPTPSPTKKPDGGGGGGGGGSNCHPSYDPCLPIVADLDCKDVRAMGKAPVTVKGPDEYRLDGDHDGIGCE